MHEWMNECTPGLFVLSSGVQYSDVSINVSSGNSVPEGCQSRTESQKAAGSGSGNDKQCCETWTIRSTSVGVTVLGLSILAYTIMTLYLKT